MLKLICATILLLLVAEAISAEAHRRHDFDDVMRHPRFHHSSGHAHGNRQAIALHDGRRSRGREDHPVSWYHRAAGRDYDRHLGSGHGNTFHGSPEKRQQQGGCPTMCPMNYSPVCGTDRKTYSNDCELRVAACTYVYTAYKQQRTGEVTNAWEWKNNASEKKIYLASSVKMLKQSKIFLNAAKTVTDKFRKVGHLTPKLMYFFVTFIAYTFRSFF